MKERKVPIVTEKRLTKRIFRLTDKISDNDTLLPIVYKDDFPTKFILEIVPFGRFCYDLIQIDDISKNLPSKRPFEVDKNLWRKGYRRYIDVCSSVFCGQIRFHQYRFIFKSEDGEFVYKYLQYYLTTNKHKAPEYVYMCSEASKYGSVEDTSTTDDTDPDDIDPDDIDPDDIDPDDTETEQNISANWLKESNSVVVIPRPTWKRVQCKTHDHTSQATEEKPNQEEV